jgi:lysozyme family protein
MKSKFEDAIGQTLKNEGGLSNNKNDPGGITKYGISLRFLQENGIDINKDGSINGKDVNDITVPEAISIYKMYFWEKSKIFLIDNQKLANKVFDLSVNMGGKQAIKLLQEAINIHVMPHLVEDGIIGLKTLKGIDSVSIDVLMADYRLCAKLFYERLVAKNPNCKVFLDGWLKRASQ